MDKGKVFRIFSHDVNHAHVKIKDKITRQILVLSKNEDLEVLRILDDKLLELLLPLYGIFDAGDHWGVTV